MSCLTLNAFETVKSNNVFLTEVVHITANSIVYCRFVFNVCQRALKDFEIKTYRTNCLVNVVFLKSKAEWLFLRSKIQANKNLTFSIHYQYTADLDIVLHILETYNGVTCQNGMQQNLQID